MPKRRWNEGENLKYQFDQKNSRLLNVKRLGYGYDMSHIICVHLLSRFLKPHWLAAWSVSKYSMSTDTIRHFTDIC